MSAPTRTTSATSSTSSSRFERTSSVLRLEFRDRSFVRAAGLQCERIVRRYRGSRSAIAIPADRQRPHRQLLCGRRSEMMLRRIPAIGWMPAVVALGLAQAGLGCFVVANALEYLALEKCRLGHQRRVPHLSHQGLGSGDIGAGRIEASGVTPGLRRRQQRADLGDLRRVFWRWWFGVGDSRPITSTATLAAGVPRRRCRRRSRPRSTTRRRRWARAAP